jgi:MarR family transcriptional regulator, transcriptional regulator for hemolysin
VKGSTVAVKNTKRPAKVGDNGIPDFSRAFGSDRRAAIELTLTWSIFVAARRWKAKADTTLSARSQTLAGLETLSSIAHRPKGMTQADLAKFMRIEAPTLVRILDRLQSDGLITRTADVSDGRRKHVILTAAGKTSLAVERRAIAALRKNTLVHLSDREIGMGIELLRKILLGL